MFSIGFQFSRSFFTRTTLYSQIQIQRKILDKYERGIVDRKKQKAFVESMYEFLKLIIEQHQRNYNEQLARAIVERTESYKSGSMKSTKRNERSSESTLIWKMSLILSSWMITGWNLSRKCVELTNFMSP